MKFGPIIICKDAITGSVRGAAAYLYDAYGIPEDHIASITVVAEVGAPTTIMVALHRRELIEEPADPDLTLIGEDLHACPAQSDDLGPCILYRGHAEPHSWRLAAERRVTGERCGWRWMMPTGEGNLTSLCCSRLQGHPDGHAAVISAES